MAAEDFLGKTNAVQNLNAGIDIAQLPIGGARDAKDRGLHPRIYSGTGT